MTQSRIVGFAGDIYPEFEREPRRLWSLIDAEELADLVKQIEPIDGKHHLNLETLQGFQRTLPWYDGVRLINLRDKSHESPRLRFYYLKSDTGLFRLNGTSPPIHKVNSKTPIKLQPQYVADYLRFFCFFVRGEAGPFYFCEDAADPLIPGAKDEKLRSVIEATARPMSYEGTDTLGKFLVDGVVFYSNAIFIANFAVQPTGMVEMLNDEPIAADLPFKIDAPLS